MSKTNLSLRQQMTDAMATLRLQIERLREGPTIGEAMDDRSVIADLEVEYEALKAAREDAGSDLG